MKILQTVITGVLAAMLMVAIPASPALAASEEIFVDPGQGKIDDYVEVSGYNFDESGEAVESFVYVTLYFTGDEADPGDEIDDEVENYEKVKSSERVDKDGEFAEVRFRVPSVLTDGDENVAVSCGSYYICVTYYGETEIVAVEEFSVIGGEISIDPDEGTVGTKVEITGTDFAEDEGLTVELDGDDIDIDYGDEETDSEGEFELSIIIPEITAGEHTITVTSDQGCEAEATFTVEPETTVSPTEAPPGDTITISGTGFGSRKDVDITLCNVDFPEVAVTDSYGIFSISLEVPDVIDGIYYIDAEDESGNEATAIQFTVEKGIALSASPATSSAQPGYVGMNITVSGTAFKPNSQITITYASTPQTVATTTSDTSGDFTATFAIPKSPAGSHIITASDGTDSLEVTFYMESQAPDTPTLLLPLMGEKAEALTSFDWEDVSDESLPVTYTLQVATSDDFSLSSMVLVKEGLISSGYTVTEGEKLAPRSKEEPYYWRVRAVDSASNESAWSGFREFYIGSSFLPAWSVTLFGFTISGWAILWWVIGCLIAGLIGYSLGKRQSS
jgi:hypothetical protein